MLTADATLDALKRYDINEADLATWEAALGLEIPTGGAGEKIYSPHHINLFKNVKKHLALGRTLEQIKSIIILPPASDAIAKPLSSAGISAILQEKDPQTQQRERQNGASTSSGKPPVIKSQPINAKSPYASVPQSQRPHTGGVEVVELVRKLTDEKDHLYQKLLETEKLNSHLYSANNLYHRRVKELELSMETLKKQLPFDENVKLMNDKAKLHKQLIEAEKKNGEYELELKQSQHAVLDLNQALTRLNQRLSEANNPMDPSLFCGDWMEEGRISEIVYDNFGINIESERVRLFRVSKAPERVFGNTAIITTHYQYESNPQWSRQETLVATYMPADQSLEGEVTAEYILDGVPVAKAIYRVHCKHHG
ncbi:MAG: MerR family transcriptional regulator [Vampirovibrionales bacterium]|nr:MerR family transcriptional regulator [Vampirovibrionales bacterium]